MTAAWQLRDEFVALIDAETGILNPRYAVQWARENPDSALHGQLDWDDEHAAEEHRVQQVRHLVAVYMVADDKSRTLISLSIDRPTGEGYRRLADVVARPDLRAIALGDALAELKRVQFRYQHLKELAGVWEATERAAMAARARPQPKARTSSRKQRA